MRRPSRRARMKRRLVLGGMALAAALVVFLIVYFVLQGKVNKMPDDKIANNIYVGSVNVSGMTMKEAKSALNKQVEKYQAETVRLVVEGKETEVTLKELGFQVKTPDTLLNQALSYGKKGSLWSRYRTLKQLDKEAKYFEAEYIVDEATVKALFSSGISELEDQAQNATIKRENGEFVITEGKTGKKIDTAKSLKAIQDYIANSWNKTGNGKIELSTVVSEPDITAEQLKTIQDPLGTFYTSFSGGGNRDTNIKLATSKINGALLMPGEEYSASDGMGPTDAEHGYLPGASYLNGQTVQTYGGGVCQVSTTLYNAVILAELEVTERWAHSMSVGYVKPSMDAAIAEGYKDFKFKNNTDTPIFIEGIATGGKLTFTIYGKELRSENRTVSYESETLSSTPAKKKFVTTQDPVGTLKRTETGHAAIKARLWKVVTENGVEVSREVVNNSTYQTSPDTWSVGIGTTNTQAKDIVQKAVATQNEAQIKAAIKQAQDIIKAAQTPETPSTTNPTVPPTTTEPEAE